MEILYRVLQIALVLALCWFFFVGIAKPKLAFKFIPFVTNPNRVKAIGATVAIFACIGVVASLPVFAPYVAADAKESAEREAKKAAEDAAAATALAKQLDDLKIYVGQHPTQILSEPLVLDKFKALLGNNLKQFSDNLSVGGNLEEKGDFYFGEGCAPHVCTIAESAFAINKRDLSVYAVILTDGDKLAVYGATSAKKLPTILNEWYSEKGGKEEVENKTQSNSSSVSIPDPSAKEESTSETSSFTKIDSLTLALRYSSNPFEVREKNIGKRYETSIFADKFIDEGTHARVLDGNSGFFCRMKGSDYGKHNKRGIMVIRGTLAESSSGIGLDDCVFVSNDTNWKAE